MKIPEGSRVPDVTFRTRSDGDWADVSSAELFDGKTVVVFSLPGAFTPTCSSTHLPRYDELAPALAERGVDQVLCVSVNDAFVMDAWAREQKVRHVRMIPDGNAEFTDALGMLVDKRDLGFGNRSWRYSMLVVDGTVTKAFVEPDKPGDPFEVSDADTMLAHLGGSATGARFATVFSRPGCPHCERARTLLDDAGIDYEEIVLGHDVTTRSLAAVTGRATVPQVYIDGAHIGGADELTEHLSRDAA